VSVRLGALRSSLRRADFLRASRQGRRFATEYFLLYLFDRKDAGPARLGITVTRKTGNAVRRNRIKRLVREWFRETRKTTPSGDPAPSGYDLVVIARRDLPDVLDLAMVRPDLDSGLAGCLEARSREP
jgi:ribonuclease P protein component